MTEKEFKSEFKRGETLDTQEFIRRARIVHGDKFDYSKSEYVASKAKIQILCPKHKSFWQYASDHLQGVGCRKCHFEGTKRWSIDHDAFLKLNYVERGAEWCSEKLEKTSAAIAHRASLLGITKNTRILNHRVPALVWNNLTSRVKSDGYILGFDRDFVAEMMDKQGGKCALTGWEIFLSNKRGQNTASIDRIDSDGDYTKDNVQLVHKLVNRCKLNNSEHDFYVICRAVTEFRKDLQRSITVFENNEWLDTSFPKSYLTTLGEEKLYPPQQSFLPEDLF